MRIREKRIIKFNLGDPDLPTPPEIVEAAYVAMKQGKTKYSSAAGEKELREELARDSWCVCGQCCGDHWFKVGNFFLMFLF